MLKVIGNMRKIQLATDAESLAGLRVAAEKGGAQLDLETRGNFLYGRSIFLGYDLPNGNGDAIPSFYAGDFGPSFVGKHLDYEHKEDAENLIGKIMATWHIESELPIGEGPRVVGRNSFGRDIEGRPSIFRMTASQGQDIRASIKELQVEGIWRIDRNHKMGDIVARRLLSGEMDSVSQEASTSHCLCSVCGHKIAFPFDPICDHLMNGSLMVRSWQVKGYDEEVLGFKVHHDPVGTGLGVVQVPAFDRAKIAEITAALKSGQMSYESALAIVHEHERMMGKETDRNLVTAAMKDFTLIAQDKAKAKPIIHAGIEEDSRIGNFLTDSGQAAKDAGRIADSAASDAYSGDAEKANRKADKIRKHLEEAESAVESAEDIFENIEGSKKDKAKAKPIITSGLPADLVKPKFKAKAKKVKAAVDETPHIDAEETEGYRDDDAHPFVVWNFYEEMPAFPHSFASVEEALAAANNKMKGWERQGYYKTNDGLRVPYSSLTVGVAYEGAKSPEGFTLCVIDDRNDSGWVKRDSVSAAAAVAEPPKKEAVPGLKAPKKAKAEYDSNALAEGTKVEKEHTTDESAAANIAMNHLDEDPKYYEKLKKVEAPKEGEAKKAEAPKEGEAKDPDLAGPINPKVDSPKDVVHILDKLAAMTGEAKAKGEKAPVFDLCTIAVPGTNLFCGENVGIPRKDMPQLKGTPVPGSAAAAEAIKGEANGEEAFKKALLAAGHKITREQIPALQLKASQSELVGSKVAGMMKALETDPNHAKITAPIFVSHDNYVLDGHHRWAALVGLQLAKGSSETINMSVEKVDMDIEQLMEFANTWANDYGIAQKAAVAAHLNLLATIKALAPFKGDSPAILAGKVHSAGVVEARLAREVHSMVRHAAIAAGLRETKQARLAPTAARITRLVELQSALDETKAAMAARTSLSLPQGAGEGAVPSWCLLETLRPLKGAKYGSPLFDVLRVEAERAMPAILGFTARICSAFTTDLRSSVSYGLGVSDQGAAAKSRFDGLIRMSASEQQKPGSFGAPKIELAAGKFIEALEVLSEIEMASAFDISVLAKTNLTLGDHRPAFAARRLRLPKEAVSIILASFDASSLTVIKAFAKHTIDHLRKPERDAAVAVWASNTTDSANAQTFAEGIKLLARSAQDFTGSLRPEAKMITVAASRRASELLTSERMQASRRTLLAAWNRMFDADPSASVREFAPIAAREAKTTILAARVAGSRLQAAGGIWPWTSQNTGGPENWPQFLENKTDDELLRISGEWENRLAKAVGLEAKMNIESNVRRVRSVLDARKQARGCTAKLIGSPDPVGAYWALKASDGTILMRVPVRRILGSKRGDIQLKWATSEEYGARLVETAEKFGIKALEASLVQAGAVKRMIEDRAEREGKTFEQAFEEHKQGADNIQAYVKDKKQIRYKVKAERLPYSSYGGNYPEDADIDEFIENNPEAVRRAEKLVAKHILESMDDGEGFEDGFDPNVPGDVESYVENERDVERFKKRVRKNIEEIVSQSMDEWSWDDLLYDLQGLMGKFNTNRWHAEGRGMGWQSRSGYKDFKAESALEFLRAIAPDTDIHVDVYDDPGAIGLRISHHDAPTGESYTVTPAEEDAEMMGSRRVMGTVKKKGSQWVVTNKSGDKTLGTHNTKESANKQLAAIEINKHKASLKASEAPVTVTSYDSVVTEESSEDGEIDHDLSDGPEDGHVTDFDESDLDAAGSIVPAIADFLRREGASEASSSEFHPGVWYESSPDEDFKTGNSTTTSFHIDGLTEDEEREVFSIVMGKGPRGGKRLKATADERIDTMSAWESAYPDDTVGQAAVRHFFLGDRDKYTNPFASGEGFYRLRWTDKRENGPDSAYPQFNQIVFDQDMNVGAALDAGDIEFLRESIGAPMQELFNKVNASKVKASADARTVAEMLFCEQVASQVEDSESEFYLEARTFTAPQQDILDTVPAELESAGIDANKYIDALAKKLEDGRAELLAESEDHWAAFNRLSQEGYGNDEAYEALTLYFKDQGFDAKKTLKASPFDPNKDPDDGFEPCNTCGGLGEHEDGEKCRRCGGTGKQKELPGQRGLNEFYGKKVKMGGF